MLTKLRIHETETGTMTFGPEMDDDPCVLCGAESRPNICGRCQKYHHHGRVHNPDHAPVALCRDCAIANGHS